MVTREDIARAQAIASVKVLADYGSSYGADDYGKAFDAYAKSYDAALSADNTTHHHKDRP